jgi:NACHT domain-containing protein
MGPRWEPSIWVRQEIATALRRGIPLFPVAFGDAAFPPGESVLPADIAGLADRQVSRIRNESWAHGTGELFKAIGKHVAPGVVRHQAPVANVVEAGLLAKLRDRVKSIWISSVLEGSLHGLAQLELGKVAVSDAVTSTWSQELELQGRGESIIATGLPILEIFERANRQLLILGEPGAGKTTTLLELTRALIAHSERDASEPIPVVFNLSTYRRGALMDWLAGELGEKYSVLGKAKIWLERELVLPLLDGLDEVAPEHRRGCIEAINEWTRRFGLRGIAVCSRTRDYADAGARLSLDAALHIEPLADPEIDRYVSHPRLAALADLLARDSQMKELARKPVMLSVLALTYMDQPAIQASPAGEAPADQRAAVLDGYIRRMLVRRGADQPYPEEHMLRWLRWLARGMMSHSESIFLIEFIQPDWLPWGWRVGHVAISSLATILSLCPYALALSNYILRDPGGPLLWESVLSAGVVSSLFVVTLSADRAYMFGLLKTYWSSRQFFVRGGKPLLLGIGVFVALRLTVSNFASLDPWVWRHLSPLVALLLAAWLVLRHIDAGFKGLERQHVIRLDEVPRSTLGAALRKSTMVLFGGWVILLLTALGVDGLDDGSLRLHEQIMFSIVEILLAMLVVYGLVMFIVSGGATLIRHYVLRLILWVRGEAPLRYGRFLDQTAHLAFMRRVGGGYAFIHRLFLEHFASRHSTQP